MKTCNYFSELKIGKKIEMEHGLGKPMAQKIAQDHLKEFPCYYSRGLLPMERKLRQLNQIRR
jgi:hypothetical protein